MFRANKRAKNIKGWHSITSPSKSLIMKSYAKINLYLDVHEKLSTGYHSITSLFSEIELFDILKFHLTEKADLKISSDYKNLENQDNLIYKIAIYLQTKWCVDYGALIYLKKNIPIAAGLGGGSSNAATTIKALSYLWKLNLSKEEMHDIAAKFGSDINFFIDGYQAIGKNRGEIIKPVESEIYIDNILLVNPNFPISSKEAYELVSLGNPEYKDNLQMLLEYKKPEYCYNKLEYGISQKYQIIKDTLTILYENGAEKAMLSGSGPTMIGFFENVEDLKKTQNIFNKKNFWNYNTRTRRRY